MAIDATKWPKEALAEHDRLCRKIDELNETLRRERQTATFWEGEAALLRRNMLDEKTAQGQLNQARAAALVYGEHMQGVCKAPKHASKVHDACTCGFSDFLVGNGIEEDGHVATMFGVALKHIEWGKTIRQLMENAAELVKLKEKAAADPKVSAP